ncbi:hypothetical protein OVA29_19675 [Exiguobacterium sp. SL14]|nr:hypothetical protein [Exiguobacterium sp. SL14]MCY1692491.1 hypothetical protein [Exiguobacterium sp. SL14]
MAGTVFDFSEARPLHEVTHAPDEELRQAGSGVDHPFLLRESGEIVLDEPISGRRLRVVTDQPESSSTLLITCQATLRFVVA